MWVMWRHLSRLSGKFAEDASRYHARFQASSGHSDGTNKPEAEIVIISKKIGLTIGIFRINFKIFRDKIGIYRHILENFRLAFEAIFRNFCI